MTDLPPFDPGEYRKRVLAAVEKRGGPEQSDPFELYDLPPADDLDDAAVADRVAQVWGAWQRQRDHPKYRVLVALLVEGHARRSAEVLDAGRRRTAAARVRAQRTQRDAARFELLDAAVSRLVARHRGIPRDKVEGLYDVGSLAGLTRDEVEVRLRRHRLVDTAAPAAAAPEPGISAARRRQVRALLDEFGRLTDAPGPATLLTLLDLAPDASPAQVSARAGAWRARARELPPARLRSVADELLVHVAELLEPGRAAVEAYLDAVAVDVAEHLRPRVRAAVLVEDRLVSEDHAHLLDEAVDRGLDGVRARAVLAGIVAELGTTIEGGSEPAPAPTTPAAPTRPAWEAPLKAARAALRAGRAAEAQRLVRDAERAAGTGGTSAVRAVADEVAAVLAEADRRRRAGTAAVAARRWTEALEHLEHLERTASDVPDPGGGGLAPLLVQAREAVQRADAAVAAALAGPDADRVIALLAVLDACPGHAAAAAALDAVPVAPPSAVRAQRASRGDVEVAWEPSTTPAVTYKVARLRPDGSWQVVGRVSGTSLLDGGAAQSGEPVYAVTAVQAGRASVPARSDEPAIRPAAEPAAAQPSASGCPPAPSRVSAQRTPDGSVVVSWVGAPGLEYRVRCHLSDGRWRTVGRTREHRISDGGAGAGDLPRYTVSAAADGARSAEVPSA